MTTSFREYDLLEYPLDEGRVLIEAAAGSGKTYTIQYLFLRLLLERDDLRPGAILVVTFTEAATEELRERIRAILVAAVRRRAAGLPPAEELRDDLDRVLARAVESAGSIAAVEERLRRARRTFDETVIATIHGFCSRILSEYAFEAGVRSRVELVKDSRRFGRFVAEEYWRRRFYSDFFTPAEKRLLATLGIELDQLVELAGELERKPGLEVLPELPQNGSWPADLKDAVAGLAASCPEWAEYCDRALEVLRSQREEIRQRLFAGRPLNAGSWKEAQFDSRADALELLLEKAGRDLPEDDQNLERFSCTFLKNKTKEKCQTPEHQFFDLCEQLWQLAADFTAGQQQAATLVRRDFVDFARGPEGFAAVKQELRRQGYGDFLTGLCRVLHEPRGELVAARIRERFRVALIDEFQDTDPVQYEIFNRLFAVPEILFYRIGDPKQSIYAFRGADIFAYLAAARESDQAKATLDRNFRSNPGLLAALNRIFEIPDPFYYKGIDYRPARAGNPPGTRLRLAGQSVSPFSFWCLAGEGRRSLNGAAATYRLAREVVDRCIRLLAEGELVEGKEAATRPVRASDIALLTRTNRQSAILWRACHARGLPAVLAAAGNLWESDEARELFFFLKAALHPENDWALSTALATSLLRREPGWLDAVRAAAAANRELEDPAGLEFLAWRLAFSRARESWKSRGVLAMLAGFPDFSDAEKNPAPGFCPALSLAAGFRGERALANFFHLQEVLHEAEQELQLGPAALLDWFHEHLAGSSRDENEYELRLESEAEAIRILTIHRSKGLEFPVVMVPFLWTGGFSDGRGHKGLVFHREDENGFVATLDLNPQPAQEHRIAAQGESLAEALRLAYVALTRAQSSVQLAWALTSQSRKSALMYLRRPPSETGRSRDFIEDKTLKATLEEIDGAGARIWEEDENIERDDLCGRFRPAAPALEAAADSGARTAKTALHPARVFRRRLPPPSGLLSFSRLTAAAHQEWQTAGFDEKELAAFAPEAPDPADVACRPPAATPSPLVNLPGGAGTGNALHEIFEKIDFTGFAGAESAFEESGRTPAGKAARELVARTLAAYGLLPAGEEEARVDEVLSLVGTVLRLTLPETGIGPLQLADPGLQRVAEMEFWLPLASVSTLSELSDWGVHRLGPDWRLELSDRLPGRGFLNGFIDLVFAASGRYFLLDWKTNNLGPWCEDYTPAALAENMQANHYGLQYHLYLVALHRLLKKRLADYDYERDFGGVYYLYLRGINPLDASTGVYFHRPCREAVEELEKIICGEVL
jgi:exodeoxyribonuclease V beta subunit